MAAKKVQSRTKKKIIEWMIDGLSITEAAKKLNVTRQTFYNWMNKEPEFKADVMSAREFAAIGLIDEIITIADDDSKDLLEDDLGNLKPNSAAIARDGLRIKARQQMGKYYNKTLFGDNQQVDVTSGGAGVVFTITPPKEIKDEQED